MECKIIYDNNGKEIKRIFTIPVGNLSEEQIKKLMNKYNETPSETDYWLPVKDIDLL